MSNELVPPDTTPLDSDESDGLLLSWIATRADLNAAETAGIAEGTSWAVSRHLASEAICDSAFLRELHRRMFGGVWKWAGRYRRSDKNIGIDWQMIAIAVEELLADCQAWLNDTTSNRWGDDEIAVRLHHRLVSIHLFPNGNGRHARLVADLLMQSLGSAALTWGGRVELADAGEARSRYIAALQSADAGDLAPLIEFARS